MYHIEFIIYLSIGFSAATMGALMGIGGGFLMVPCFIFMGYTKDYAPVLSSFVIIFVSLSASIKYTYEKSINYQLGLMYAPFSIIGAFLGAYLVHLVDTLIFKIIFSVLIVYVGIRFIIKKEKDSIQPLLTSYENQRKSYYWVILWGFVTGVTASFVGIGGGLIAVPVIHLFFLETIHIAIATSLFIMIFTSSFSTLQHYLLSYIDSSLILIGLIVAIGAIIGSQIGSYIQPHLKKRTLQIIFGSFIICIAIPLLWLRL